MKKVVFLLVVLASLVGTLLVPLSVTAASTTLLISEVQVAGSSDADLEFIEIYNATDTLLTLAGYNIVYRSASGTTNLPVYTFDAADSIPAHGHFLLIRYGKTLSVAEDATFTQALGGSGGGLALRDASNNIVDSIGWGNATNAFVEGTAVTAPAGGSSAERKPGNAAGNAQDTDNNSSDFAVLTTPLPQNTGSDPTPGGGAAALTLSKTAPDRVNPGQLFTYTLVLRNTTGLTLTNVAITDTVPGNVQFASASDGGTLGGGAVVWTVASLVDGASVTRTFNVTAPATGGTAMVNAVYQASASNWLTVTSGSAVTTTTRLPVLEVSKSAPAQVTAGATFAYQLTVNNGLGSAASGWLSDTLPASVAFVGATAPYTWDAGTRTVLWNLGSIADGGSAARTITVTAPTSATTVVNASYAAWATERPTPTFGTPVSTSVLLNETCQTSSPKIYQIQGHGTASPCVNKTVSNVTGCVIGVSGTGYYLQDPTGDGDTGTSDGIFIYVSKTWTNTQNIAVGQSVRFSGKVTEFYNTTEVAYPTAQTIVGSCSAMPGYADISMIGSPYDNPETLYERFEGMRVRLLGMDGFVEGATRRYVSRFPVGDPEIAYVPYSFITNHLLINDPRIFQEDYTGYQGLMYLNGGLNRDLPLAEFGDRITATAVSGVMGYMFDKYTLLVDQPYTGVIHVTANPALPVTTTIKPLLASEFSVCTINVENLFDEIDDGDGDLGDWSASDEAEYDLWLTKRAAALADELHGCSVIGLEEVEGKEQVWADLVAAVNTRLGNAGRFAYDYYESQDERDITVGIVYDTWKSSIVSSTQRQGCSSTDYSVSYANSVAPRVVPNPCSGGTYALFDRAPYVATMRVTTTVPYTFTIMVNHLKSKRGDEAVNLPRRELQASWLVTLTRQYNLNNPVIIVGDLNDYLTSTPIKILENATDAQGNRLLINVVTTKIPKPLQYTFVFNGESEVLDHFFATRDMEPYLVQSSAVHINADYPASLIEDETAHRSSDHDPLFTRFRVLPPTGLVHEVTPSIHVPLGSVVTYTMVLTRESGPTATAMLTDVLPAAVTFGGWVAQPAGSAYASGRVTWSGIVSGEVRLVFTATVSNDPALFGSIVVNTATLAANDEVRDVPASFTVIAAPGLQASTKTADRTLVSPGGVITYTINLVNNGGSDASVYLTDTLHSALAYITGTPGLTYANGRVTWHGALAPGASLPLTLTVQVASLVGWWQAGGGDLTNTVTLNNGYGTLTTHSAAPVAITARILFLPIVMRKG